MHDYQRTFSSWDVSSGLDSVINLRYSNIFVKLSGACERKCSAFKIHRYLLSVNLRSFDYIMSKWFVKINFGHKIIIAPLVTVTIVIRVVQKTKTSSDLLFFFLTDENECDPSRSPCDLNANCTNTKGSFECQCKPGFTGDGFRCQRGELRKSNCSVL